MSHYQTAGGVHVTYFLKYSSDAVKDAVTLEAVRCHSTGRHRLKSLTGTINIHRYQLPEKCSLRHGK